MALTRIRRAVGWSVLVCTLAVLLIGALVQAAQIGGSVQAVVEMTA